MLQAIRHEHEIVPKIEDWRELTKLKSTYLDAFPDLVGARRPAAHHLQPGRRRHRAGCRSTNPNLQNIPIRTERGREIRACFVAEEGNRLISADYSQVELRLLAHIAGEDVLKEIFRRGEDVHTATAEQILGGKPDPGTRSKAKMVNYGIVYGLSAYGLADRLQIPQEEAQEFIDRYLERFPAVKEFIEDDHRARDQRGLRGHRVRPHPPHPRAARAPAPDAPAGRAAGGEHGDPGHRGGHHQGGDGALPGGAARRGAGDQAGAPDPRRAAVRGARGRGGGRRPRSCAREMAGAFEMDPPLEVDVAAASNWLEAK